MRGVVSLAAALALSLPLAVPGRDLIIYLTYCVILATLVGQGLSVPWVVPGSARAGTSAEREEAVARQAAVDAALLRLDGLAANSRTTYK